VTTSIQTGPWQALPPSVADVIEPELDAITEEIMATIAREVPAYARPFEGSFGRGVRTGVTEALRQFLALIRSPSGARGPGREVYLALGRGELRQGRTLDSLQSAYRVGARVAWRRVAEVARRAGLDPETISLLAESIFAYIEEISADSVEGYAEAQSQLEDERRRRRRELVALLLREPPADEADLRAATAGTGWRLPRTAAALAVPEDELDRMAARLPADALAERIDGVGCVVVPDPEGPGRAAGIERALAGERSGPAEPERGGRPRPRSAPSPPRSAPVLGPAGPLRDLPASWSLASATLRAIEAGAIEAEGRLLRADDALGDLLLFENRALVERIAARRLAPLRELTQKARARMEETALAYLRERGNAAAMARALEVHPQTARYRLARLRELLGEELDDPDARFELELALRGRPPGS
jgi:hypothetical protein